MRLVGRMLIAVTVLAVFLIVVICAGLFMFQRSLIYFPQPRANRADSVLMTVSLKDAKVNVSARPRIGLGAVIYFGGNAEDVSQDISELADVFSNKAIYALHYPGYGGSSGSPSEQAIFIAALALFDQVHTEHTNVVVIGRSLGSGVAVWVASQRPIARLVLVTPFDSLGDAAAKQFGFLPVRWLLRDRFESFRYAPSVKAPTRMIVAGSDEIIPLSSSERLRTRFQQSGLSYVLVPGFGHNTIQESPGYWELLSRE